MLEIVKGARVEKPGAHESERHDHCKSEADRDAAIQVMRRVSVKIMCKNVMPISLVGFPVGC